MPLRAPSVTLFISGSSTYSLLMPATTPRNTPMCLYVSSGDLLWPNTLPIRSRTVRHDDALTTKYLVRLLIGFSLDSYSYTAIILIRRASRRFGSAYFQPFLWRRPVMWAAWCRPCQA